VHAPCRSERRALYAALAAAGPSSRAIDFHPEVSYSPVRGCDARISGVRPGGIGLETMSRAAETILLLALCVISVVLGLITGKAVHNIGLALFFYLLSGCFFFAVFRPHNP
jgi:hypothetical protein